MPSGIGPMCPMPQPPRSSGLRVAMHVARDRVERRRVDLAAGEAGHQVRPDAHRLGDLRAVACCSGGATAPVTIPPRALI